MLAEAVEDLARALGLWESDEGAGIVGSFRLNGRYIVRMRPGPDDHELAPLEAMLWLRCYMLGPTRERCPDCEGALVERRRDLLSDLEWLDGEGGWVPLSGPLEFGYHRIWVRLCPTCTGPAVEEWTMATPGGWTPRAPGLDGPTLPWLGTVTELWRVAPGGFACRSVPGKPTGWLTREHGWAERWLRAQPQECHGCPACDGTIDDDGPRCVGLVRPGDPEVRDQISVKADELAERGQPGCSTCEGSQLEKAGTVLGFLATGTLDAWKRSNPESEGWSVWSQPERGVMVGGGDGVRIVCRRPCPSCASARRLSLWLALWLAGKPCEDCDGLGEATTYTAGDGGFSTPEDEPCEPCHGSGLELGHHSTAMAEAVARLGEDLERAELK